MTIILCPNCEERISVTNPYGNYICPICEEGFNAENAEYINDNYPKSSTTVKEAEPLRSGIIGIVCIAVIIFIIIKLFSGTKWTLFVCSELLNPNNPYECMTNALIKRDAYKDIDECRFAGQQYLNQYPGYECGYKCEFGKYDTMLWTCKRFN